MFYILSIALLCSLLGTPICAAEAAPETSFFASILPPATDPTPYTDEEKAELTELQEEIEGKIAEDGLPNYKKVELEKLKTRATEFATIGAGSWETNKRELEDGLEYVKFMATIESPVNVTETITTKGGAHTTQLLEEIGLTSSSNLFLAKKTSAGVFLYRLWNRNAYVMPSEYMVIGSPEHLLSDPTLQPLSAMIKKVLNTPGTQTHSQEDFIRFIGSDGMYYCYNMGNLSGCFYELSADQVPHGQTLTPAAVGLEEKLAALPTHHMNSDCRIKTIRPELRYITNNGHFAMATLNNNVPDLAEGDSVKKAYIGFGPDIVGAIAPLKSLGNQTSHAWYTNPEESRQKHRAYQAEEKRKYAVYKAIKNIHKELAPNKKREPLSERYTPTEGASRIRAKGLTIFTDVKPIKSLDTFYFIFDHAQLSKIPAITSDLSSLGIDRLKSELNDSMGRHVAGGDLFAGKTTKTVVMTRVSGEGNAGTFKDVYPLSEGEKLAGPYAQIDEALKNKLVILFGFASDLDALLLKKGENLWEYSPFIHINSKSSEEDVRAAYDFIKERGSQSAPVTSAKTAAAADPTPAASVPTAASHLSRDRWFTKAQNNEHYERFKLVDKKTGKWKNLGWFVVLFDARTNQVSTEADKLGIADIMPGWANRSECKLIYAHPDSSAGNYRDVQFLADGAALPTYEGTSATGKPIAYGFGPDFEAFVVKKEGSDTIWEESDLREIYNNKDISKPAPPVVEKKKKKKWYQKMMFWK